MNSGDNASGLHDLVYEVNKLDNNLINSLIYANELSTDEAAVKTEINIHF